MFDVNYTVYVYTCGQVLNPPHPAWYVNALPTAPGVMLSYLIVGVFFYFTNTKKVRKVIGLHTEIIER